MDFGVFLLLCILCVTVGGILALIILPVALFSWVKKRLKALHWKPVTATVLRIEAIDPQIGKDTVGPRTYRLDLVFGWQGLDWHRSWHSFLSARGGFYRYFCSLSISCGGLAAGAV